VVNPAPGQGAAILPFPGSGAVLTDVRGENRWMRVTWHDEAGVVVLSLWRDASCVSTLRLAREDVPALVSALVNGLAAPST
jgi:hypothetical protein